jgi:hypothetical protein
MGFAIVKKIIGFFKGDFGDMPDELKGLLSGLKDIIIGPFKEAFDWITSKWDSLKNTIGLGEGGVISDTLGTMRTGFKTLTGYARGGLITKPTVASFAERGPEVAVPVGIADRGLGMANLDIASRALGLGGARSGGKPVTIEASPVIQVTVNGGDPEEIRRVMIEVMREYGAKMIPEWAARIARTSYATG